MLRFVPAPENPSSCRIGGDVSTGHPSRSQFGREPRGTGSRGRRRHLGSCPDGIHACLPHHSRAAGRVLGGDDTDRQLSGSEARRQEHVASRPEVVEVHGGHFCRGRSHRHRAQLRVRAALATFHGSMGRRIRDSLRLRGHFLLHRGGLHRHLHLWLASIEAVDPLLDRCPGGPRGDLRVHLGRRRQCLDADTPGLHSRRFREYHGGRPDFGDLQSLDAAYRHSHMLFAAYMVGPFLVASVYAVGSPQGST